MPGKVLWYQHHHWAQTSRIKSFFQFLFYFGWGWSEMVRIPGNDGTLRKCELQNGTEDLLSLLPCHPTYLSHPTSSSSSVMFQKGAKTILQMVIFREFPLSSWLPPYPWRQYCWCIIYCKEAHLSPLYAEGFGHDMTCASTLSPASHRLCSGRPPLCPGSRNGEKKIPE